MPYIVQNTATKEVGHKIYPTERGAKSGKRAIISNALQSEYLKKGGPDYGTFMFCHYAKTRDKSHERLQKKDMPMIQGLIPAAFNFPTAIQIDEYFDRKAELEREWVVIKKEFK